ncbi:hypothetical protein BY996DRAFT_8454838 [Phakopsora pachyrhizi]|nr:hypothetical protein BY996DRAFT_8454838 [Phakopsora pachyrhizi]
MKSSADAIRETDIDHDILGEAGDWCPFANKEELGNPLVYNFLEFYPEQSAGENIYKISQSKKWLQKYPTDLRAQMISVGGKHYYIYDLSVLKQLVQSCKPTNCKPISCIGLSMVVERIGALEGIRSVSAALIAGRCKLELDPTIWSPKQITSEIEDLGFDAQLLSVVENRTLQINPSSPNLELLNSTQSVIGVYGLTAETQVSENEQCKVDHIRKIIPLRNIVDHISSLGLDPIVTDMDSSASSIQLQSLAHMKEVNSWQSAAQNSFFFALPVFVIQMIVPMLSKICDWKEVLSFCLEIAQSLRGCNIVVQPPTCVWFSLQRLQDVSLPAKKAGLDNRSTDVLTWHVPLLFYADDTSGNVFVATSNIASGLELAAPVFEELNKLSASWFTAFDCSIQGDVLLLPVVLLFMADSPMHAEITSKMQPNVSLQPCRIHHLNSENKKEKATSTHVHRSIGPKSNGSIQIASKNQIQWCIAELGVKDILNQAVTKVIQENQDTRLVFNINKIYEDRRQQNFNPFFELKVKLCTAGIEPATSTFKSDALTTELSFGGHKDTPVEVLHMVLLGIIKYLYCDIIGGLSGNKKEDVIARLQSFDTGNLNIPPIKAKHLVQHYSSLVRKDFNVLIQASPFFFIIEE